MITSEPVPVSTARHRAYRGLVGPFTPLMGASLSCLALTVIMLVSAYSLNIERDFPIEPIAVLALLQSVPMLLLVRQIRLARSAWRFPSVVGQHVVVRCDPLLYSPTKLTPLLQVVEEDLAELRRQFGRQPRGGVTIFVASYKEVSRLYGRDQVGFALVPGTIVVADAIDLRETIRHELSHLFLRPWHTPLLCEGFAMWWQKTRDGVPIDLLALRLLCRQELSLHAMLERTFFQDPSRERDCYLLAGSFTGWLLRRLDWSSYLRFYRTASWRGVRGSLKRHLGLTLEQAEEQWREELPEIGLRPRLLDYKRSRELGAESLN